MSALKRNIFENPCSEKWESMSGLGENRKCDACNEIIHDLENFDLKSIATDYLNSGKCVKMNFNQVELFRHLKSVQNATGLSLLLLLSQPNIADAQFTSSPAETIIIKGRIKKEFAENSEIFVVSDQQRFSTKADENGEFTLAIPKNVEIEKSNIPRLVGRSIRREKINLHKVSLQRFRVIGTPSF